MRERPEKKCMYICTDRLPLLSFLWTTDTSKGSKNDLKFLTGTRNLCRITRNVELDVIRVMRC